MNAVTLDQAIDVAMQLPLEQREILLEIIRSRDIEARREEIAQDARESLAAFHAGELKPQTAGEVMLELRRDIEDRA